MNPDNDIEAIVGCLASLILFTISCYGVGWVVLNALSFLGISVTLGFWKYIVTGGLILFLSALFGK